jgi:hypothetical protein
MKLRHVLGRRDGKRWGLGLADIVVDRQRLEGGERANQTKDIVALDELLRLGACGRGNAGSVGDNQFDLPARKLLLRSLRCITSARSLSIPPEASGPVFTVRSPTRTASPDSAAAISLARPVGAVTAAPASSRVW